MTLFSKVSRKLFIFVHKNKISPLKNRFFDKIIVVLELNIQITILV